MVVKRWIDVETRGVVLTTGVLWRVGVDASLDVAGASADVPGLLRVGVGEAFPFPLSEGAGVEAGGAAVLSSSEEGAGGSEVWGGGALEGAGVGDGVDVRGGGVEGAGEEGVGVEGAALPVPEACRFSPWWM